jgi:hypothetical protein
MHYRRQLGQVMPAVNEPRQQTPMAESQQFVQVRHRAQQHRAIQAVVRQQMIAMKKVSSYEP